MYDSQPVQLSSSLETSADYDECHASNVSRETKNEYQTGSTDVAGT